MTKKDIDSLTYEIVGAAIEVHRHVGPGLLESVYHQCMVKELHLRNLQCVSETSATLDFKGLKIDTTLRCDLLVENSICVELKAVEALLPVHEAQLLTYMRLLEMPKGILINFSCTNIFK